MTFTIRLRGVVKAKVEGLDAALSWLHANQRGSALEAVTTGGYRVTDETGKRWFEPRKRFRA